MSARRRHCRTCDKMFGRHKITRAALSTDQGGEEVEK